MTTYLVSYQETKIRTRVVEAPDLPTAIHATYRSIIDGYDQHGSLSNFGADPISGSSNKPSIMVSRSILGSADAMRLLDRIVVE